MADWLKIVFLLGGLWLAKAPYAWGGDLSPDLSSLAQRERDQIIHPRMAVPLLYGSSLRPHKAVVASDRLYFLGKQEGSSCAYTDVFWLPLLGDHPPEESEVQKEAFSCVSDLYVAGNLAVVRFRSEGGIETTRVHFKDQWVSLANAYPAIWAPIQWARHRHLESGSFHSVDFEQTSWRWQSQKGLTIALSADLEKGWLFFLESFLAEKKNERPRITRYEGFDKQQAEAVLAGHFQWDGAGSLYTTLPSSPDGKRLGRVEVWRADLKKTIAFGADVPYAEAVVWEVLERSGSNPWAVRAPLHYATADYGAVVFESSQRRNEWQTYSYLSPYLEEVSRVQLPVDSGAISGLQIYQGGLLASYPDTGSVLWFGKKSPFSVLRFSARNLGLRALSEQELIELNQDQSEPKRSR